MADRWLNLEHAAASGSKSPFSRVSADLDAASWADMQNSEANSVDVNKGPGRSVVELFFYRTGIPEQGGPLARIDVGDQ